MSVFLKDGEQQTKPEVIMRKGGNEGTETGQKMMFEERMF